MPTLTVRCKCGTLFHVEDLGDGGRIKCRRCGRLISVRRRRRSPARVLGDAWRAAVVAPIARLVRRRAAERGAHRRSRRGRRRPSPVVRALRVLSWGYLAASCLIAAVLWGLGDAWWPATLLLFIGRWGFLLPLLVLVPAVLVLRRAPLVPLLVGGLVVLGPVMGFRTGWRRILPRPAGARLRVVTFNADGGELVAPRLAFLVAEWAADVVAIQECGEALTNAARRVEGYYHHDAEGLCLLSRFPIRSAEAMDRAALERLRVRGWETGRVIGGAGYVIRYAIAAPWGTFGFTNLHLETPRKGLDGLLSGDVPLLRVNTELRDIESSLARRWVDGSAGPRLVAGDFNTPIESRIFQRHWDGLADAFSRVGTGFGYSKYNGWIRVRIDHVLAGDGWRARRAEMGGDVGSDHRPLIVDLTRVGT